MIIDIVFNWYCAVKHIHSKITRELAKKIKRQMVKTFAVLRFWVGEKWTGSQCLKLFRLLQIKLNGLTV